MKENCMGLVVSLLLCLVSSLCYAQVWVARYNGPANTDDKAHAIVVDGSGNVYVAGASYGAGTYEDYATIKYSPAGDTLWVRRYNGPGDSTDVATAIAVNDSGNVYVTGYSIGAGTGSDYATIKYSTSGEELWVRRYNAQGGGYDKANAMAVDGSGNVYVTGYSYGACATIKYSPAGDTLWVRRYNGSGTGGDVAKAIAVDSSRNVYVTGYRTCPDGCCRDYLTIKYNSAGDTLWVRMYDGPDFATVGDWDEANAIGVDDSGNVYVTGYSYGSGYNDYATIKYNSSGDTLWVRRYNGPGNRYDKASAITVDEASNVYVTGYSYDSSNDFNYATIKYDSSGDTLWVRRYNGPGNGSDDASAIAVDGNGDIYVTGASYGAGTYEDYATIKYSPAGDTLWVRRYNGPGDSTDVACGIAVNGDYVYVTGKSYGVGTSYDYATIRYSVAGVEEKPNIRKQKATILVHPNPFISKLNIKFNLPSASNIKLSIYDISGREVVNLINGFSDSGSVVWEARKTLSGIYFVRLDTKNFAISKKVTLFRK